MAKLSKSPRRAVPKTVGIIGAGGRGTGFAALIEDHSYLGKVTAVAEPRDEYREALARTHGIARPQVFQTWQEDRKSVV